MCPLSIGHYTLLIISHDDNAAVSFSSRNFPVTTLNNGGGSGHPLNNSGDHPQ